MKTNIYRFDSRTPVEFSRDIKEAHQLEQEIIRRYGKFIEKQTGKFPTIQTNGSDMSGKFIENVNNVSFSADFLVNGELVEVTRSDVLCPRVFHHKTHKINSLIKKGSSLLFVNACKSINPQFVILDPEELAWKTREAVETYGVVIQRDTGKESYRYNVNWFNWNLLPF